MLTYEQVFENNLRWIEKHKAEDASFFEEMAKGQSPDFLYIGCSDSRVKTEHMIGAGPGEVFVHRNIANLVSIDDLSVMCVVEYAVVHLKVKHVVVCGHYGCGGVKASQTDADLGTLNPWLDNIRSVYRLHRSYLDSIMDEEEKHNKLVELNVQEQCINLIRNPIVRKGVFDDKTITLHGWVLDMESGKLIDLNLKPEKLLKEIL